MIAYCPLEDLEPRQQEVVASVPQKEVPEIGAEDTELNYLHPTPCALCSVPCTLCLTPYISCLQQGADAITMLTKRSEVLALYV